MGSTTRYRQTRPSWPAFFATLLLTFTVATSVHAQFELPPIAELEIDPAPAVVDPPVEENPGPDADLFPEPGPVPPWVERGFRSFGDIFLPPPEPDLLEEGEPELELWIDLAPEPPAFAEEPKFPLPALSSLGLSPMASMAAALAIPVTGFAFEGNTAFTTEELGEVVGPFLAKKNLTADDLQDARLALTKHYMHGGQTVAIENATGGEDGNAQDGYITSGATLPDQDPFENDGVVTFKIVEGKLTRIEIEWVKTDADGERKPARKLLWNHYLKPRVARGAGVPLHMGEMRETLQLIQKNPNIKRINAEVKPDSEPGESYLKVEVEPERPWRMGTDFHNTRPPSVGAEQIEFWFEHTSLTRHSDRLGLRYGLLERGIESGEISGDANFEIDYTLPITRLDTLFDLAYSRNGYAVIEEPFTTLGIEGETETWRAGFRQPLRRTEHDELNVGLHLEHRRSETRLFGFPFSLTPGSVMGEIDLTALRLSGGWVHRDADSVFALNSVLSIGVDAFEPTDNGTERDGEFISWLGQAQFVRRFELPRSNYAFQAVARANVQLANSPLLAPEQYSVGGGASVRGYRENQLVRDMGYFGSLELRFPVWQNDRGSVFSVAPFVDAGGGWNHVENGIDNAHETLTSAGIGLLLNIRENVEGSIYWGHGFTEFTPPGGSENLQDHGVHFRLSVRTR